jgi:hypothetical protein
MIIELNLEQRALIALLIKDEISLVKQYREKVISEINVEYFDEKIDAYETIYNKL